jgi:CDP-6-deoxy-D-xylo-4-hexulose-3-dehydrase
MMINLAEDTISKDDIVALTEWLLTFPHLTKGELTEEFEHKFARYMGSKHAIFVSSGSSANLLAANALRAVGGRKQNTVIVPAVSWVTTVTPFLQLGYKVVMCDCDRDNLGVDVGHFEELCQQHQPNTAIIVHVLGHDSSILKIKAICDRYGVRLVEDTCEAIGSALGAQKLGTFGDFGTFSLYFGHQISSIEGGVIVTDDFDLAQIARSMRAHGWARDLDPTFRQKLEEINGIDDFQGLYTFYYSGFNCRSTDLNAFLALRQLDILPKVVDVRDRNYHAYRGKLDKFWAQTSKTDKVSSFAYGMIVGNRRDLVAALKDAQVTTRPLICGSMARQPLMREEFATAHLPVADIVHMNGLYLPNHLHISEQQINLIAEIVNAAAVPFDLPQDDRRRPSAGSAKLKRAISGVSP